ncbi:MAG: TfoX/Sxy family protein [Lautropia sp.]
MPTRADFMNYVLDQARPNETPTCRRMFGEYALYLDAKVVALVCDDVVFLKPTDIGRALLGHPDEAPAYPGGKPWFRLGDIVEERDRFQALLRATADALPMPRPRKAKVKRAGV